MVVLVQEIRGAGPLIHTCAERSGPQTRYLVTTRLQVSSKVTPRKLLKLASGCIVGRVRESRALLGVAMISKRIPRLELRAHPAGAIVVRRLLFLLITALCVTAVRARDDTSASAGEAIYRRGVVASGKPLEGEHRNGVRRVGADAACINCHRRSGLGEIEGRSSIPPITGRYLMHARAKSLEDLDLPYVDAVRLDRDPYTDATIARAIRSGLNSEGKPLNDLMPRFALGDEDMAALISYLKSIDPRRVAGVTDTVLHFATIITPDADPVKRQGMLDVIEHYFTEKNSFHLGPSPRLRSTRMMMFKVNRQWQLHIWELTGEPSTWEQQLQDKLVKEPVFAVISGLGGKTWAPVHSFCEHAAVPCLFPNVEVPVDAERDFYSIYLSRGVLLEAQLIASRILGPAPDKIPRTVHQIYRASDVGESGAAALAAALERHGVTVVKHVLEAGDPEKDVAAAVHSADKADALVLWLRAGDVAALGDPPSVPVVYMSGQMAGLERAPVPSDWRERTRMAYPFDLPDLRRVRVDYPMGWFSIRHIPVVAQQVQADTYLACGILSEALSHMVDTFVRDYLIERIEGMVEHRVITGYYPRLTLSQKQRFASKGGYIVRFADANGIRVVADGEWIAP